MTVSEAYPERVQQNAPPCVSLRMNKGEFAARLAAYKKDTKREAIPALILLFGVLFGTIALAPYIVESTSLTVLYCVTVMGVMLGWAKFVERSTGHIHQKHKLTCPFCNQAWVSTVSRQIVMATGKCGHCGTRVLEEE